MDIGSGIALLGVWLFPTACVLSSDITSFGVTLSIIVASVMTVVIL